jgi:hypothetical protein
MNFLVLPEFAHNDTTIKLPGWVYQTPLYNEVRVIFPLSELRSCEKQSNTLHLDGESLYTVPRSSKSDYS